MLLAYFDNLYILYFVFLLVNTMLYTAYGVKNRSKWAMILAIYFWTEVLIELASLWVGWKYGNNIYLSHINNITLFLLLSWFYYTIIRANEKIRSIPIILIICSVLFVAQFFLFPGIWKDFNNFEKVLLNYFLFLWSLIYAHSNLLKRKKFNIINFGMLCYSVLSCSIFLFVNVFEKWSLEHSLLIWFLNLILVFVLQIIFVIQWFYFVKNKSEIYAG